MQLVPMPDGSFFVLVSEDYRKVFALVANELRVALETGYEDPSFKRLFPTAYAEDPEHQQFYEQMTHGDLADSRISALQVLADTIDNETISADELNAWMYAVNSLRLVLGTRLDISEDLDPDDIDPDDPDAMAFVVYDLLTALLGRIVNCLQMKR